MHRAIPYEIPRSAALKMIANLMGSALSGGAKAMEQPPPSVTPRPPAFRDGSNPTLGSSKLHGVVFPRHGQTKVSVSTLCGATRRTSGMPRCT